jgi:hypothetical protein
MKNVLPRTAGNLQHNALPGQNPRKDIEYRAFVALRCVDEPFPVSLLFTTLPKHQYSVKANVGNQRPPLAVRCVDLLDAVPP